MATILVVDDRPTNREYLVTLFGYANHRCLEAKDGVEALALARSERPDLVVTDLLMPTMDGHELVRQLRSDPELAPMKVIFYSATYTVPQARAMAASCGVKTVLSKPSDPEVILESVNRELGLASSASIPPRAKAPGPGVPQATGAAMDVDPSLEACISELRSTAHLLEEMAELGEDITQERGELRPLSERLSRGLGSLRKAATRRAAIDDLCVRLLGDRQPSAMTDFFTEAAGRILDAPVASVCVLDSRETDIVHLAAHGADVGALRAAALDRSRLPGSLLLARTPVRAFTGPAAPDPWLRGISEGGFLGLPIRTNSQLHGWMCFGRRSGAPLFDEEDERIALSLAARFAVVYENAMLFETVQRHAARLQIETGERERSRTRLIESEQRFRQIAENIKEVFWLTDPSKNEMLYISPAYEEIWGRRVDSLYTSPLAWLEAIHPDDQSRVRHAMETKQRSGTYNEEYRIVRPDAAIRWVNDKAFPVADADGVIYRIAGVAEDITVRREGQAALASSLREKEALLREVHHRVKNNMQVISSLLRLEANRAEHPITHSVLRDMQNRILAMAALHETLYRSGDFSRVNLADYLGVVVRQMTRVIVATPGLVSFALDLEPVSVDMERAIPCGLVLNELASNALKHGFPDGGPGTVWVELHRRGSNLVALRVRDDGVGLPDDWSSRMGRSLGLQIAFDLSRQLGGRLEVGPGSAFEVLFPEETSARPTPEGA